MKKLNDKNFNKTNIIFILILILQIVNVVYWGAKKEGYHCDEVWTYGLSNSYYEPFLQDSDNYMNTWHDSQFYHDYLTVQNNEKFSYSSVYYNQTKDVHPPIYYFLIHSICSMFPDEFSKWYGISLNILFYILTNIIIFLLSKKFIKKDMLSLLPTILYGFSIGAVSTVIYIRMYMMLTFWVIFYLYLHVMLYEKERKSTSYRKILLSIFGVTICGFLTQYYFIVYAFFISAFYFTYKIFLKKIEEVIDYSIIMCISVISGVIFFPKCIYHIFKGSRGAESFKNLSSGSKQFIANAKGYFEIINNELFAGLLKLIILLISFIILFKVILFFIKLEYSTKGNRLELYIYIRKHDLPLKISLAHIDIMVIIATCATLCYYLTMFKITVGVRDRYIFATYPLLILAYIWLLKLIGSNKKIFNIIISVLLIIITIYSYKVKDINYLYIGYSKALNYVKDECSDNNAIYITPGYWRVNNDALFLQYYKEVYTTNEDGINQLKDIFKQYDKDRIMVYIANYYDKDKILDKIKKETEYTKATYYYDNSTSYIYILEKK